MFSQPNITLPRLLDEPQAQKPLLRRLDRQTRQPGPPDIESVANLVEEAASMGFSGESIDKAKESLSRHRGEQKALAYVR